MSIIKKYFYYKADYSGDKKYVDVPIMYIEGAYNDTWVNHELIYIGKRDAQYFTDITFIQENSNHPLKKPMSDYVLKKFWKFAVFFDPETDYVIYIPMRYIDNRFDNTVKYDGCGCYIPHRNTNCAEDKFCLWNINDHNFESDGTYLLPIMVTLDYDEKFKAKYKRMLMDPENEMQIKYEKQKSQDDINKEKFSKSICHKMEKFFKDNNISFLHTDEGTKLIYNGTEIDYFDNILQHILKEDLKMINRINQRYH